MVFVQNQLFLRIRKEDMRRRWDGGERSGKKKEKEKIKQEYGFFTKHIILGE